MFVLPFCSDQPFSFLRLVFLDPRTGLPPQSLPYLHPGKSTEPLHHRAEGDPHPPPLRGRGHNPHSSPQLPMTATDFHPEQLPADPQPDLVVRHSLLPQPIHYSSQLLAFHLVYRVEDLEHDEQVDQPLSDY